MHPFHEYVNPHLGRLLNSIKMDKGFTRGEGCYLYDEQGNRYLDCIAAYGALPFGHNPPEIWASIDSYRRSGEPNFIQPSFLNAAGELAARLVELAPDGLRYVTFTNSGAEAVEAAIKLCRSATGRRGILATENSFHGKTTGALSATGNPDYQEAFAVPYADFHHIPFGDPKALLEELAARPGYFAAFIVEPIQGEGGIVVPPPGYLAAAKEICAQHQVLLILDEVQTGLGRTGTLFACEPENVTPDVLLLAKALGGGLMPIGAVISTETVFNRDFAEKHSSTFAGNALACRVGLQVLEMLTRDGGSLLRHVQSTGCLLKEGLEKLQKKYPRLIKSVRGRGLMLGLEFNTDRETYPGSLLGFMGEQKLLTPAISAYLLNREKIRVAPTLNGNAVIRIEPPLTITADQCKMALAGLDNMLAVLDQAHTARFLSFLVTEAEERRFPAVARKPEKPQLYMDGDVGRFAFLVHPLDLQSYHQFDASLLMLSEEELQELVGRFNDIIEPFVLSHTGITSSCGTRAYGEFIVVPRTTAQFVNMPRRQALAELKAAVRLARDRGARIVGLGAYTAVASMGGLYLKDEGIPVTSGNSYTVVSAVDAVNEALEKLQVKPESTTAAVVGAAGSIGKGIALLLSETVARLILIGNPKNKDSSINRMEAVAAEIYRYLAGQIQDGRQFNPGSIGDTLARCPYLPSPDQPPAQFIKFLHQAESRYRLVQISIAIDEVLSGADVAVSATNSRGKLIHPGNLKQGAIVCDISRPANVSEDLDRVRPDVLVLDGGVVEVPGLPNLGWNFGFEEGLAYACMAETMMLALERHYEHYSLGSSGVNLDTILETRRWAEKHGFKLAAFRSFNRPLSEERWQKLLLARRRAG